MKLYGRTNTKARCVRATTNRVDSGDRKSSTGYPTGGAVSSCAMQGRRVHSAEQHKELQPALLARILRSKILAEEEVGEASVPIQTFHS